MRKTSTVTVASDGRDAGKTFFLREMPAAQAEKWALRVFLAMGRAGIDIPEHIASAGLAGVAAIGVRALGSMAFSDAEPLLDEMFACVQIIPDPRKPQVVRPLIEDDIEEIATRFWLRKQVLGLHIDFFKLGALLTSASAAPQDESTPST